MGKATDLSPFGKGVIVGARLAGASISKMANLTLFSKADILKHFKSWNQNPQFFSRRRNCGSITVFQERDRRRFRRITLNLARTRRNHKSILPYLHYARVWWKYPNKGHVLYHGSDALIFLESKQTAIRYLDILADQEQPSRLHFYPDDDGHFMDGNATIHRARSVQNWLAEHQSDLRKIPLTPHSQDINPVENVWDIAEKHIQQHSPLPSHLQD
ncbi:DDE_3 domain-containing protein [Trichonephila clavipes]|nr:DDE_3 domain-containing protein [Trichonephila clavipes]